MQQLTEIFLLNTRQYCLHTSEQTVPWVCKMKSWKIKIHRKLAFPFRLIFRPQVEFSSETGHITSAVSFLPVTENCTFTPGRRRSWSAPAIQHRLQKFCRTKRLNAASTRSDQPEMHCGKWRPEDLLVVSSKVKKSRQFFGLWTRSDGV